MHRFLLSLLTVIGWHAVTAQPITIAPPAGWVVTREDLLLTPTPSDDVSYGYDYLLLDRQVNIREQSMYWRSVYRITSQGALQSGARETWNYDPAYEHLTLHHLRVIRDGVRQERLEQKLLQIIQRESDLDRHMLNGEMTALALLDDIRVGDVVDTAYTRKGWNPTFGGRFFQSIALQWAVPVRDQYIRIMIPEGRSVQHKIQGDSSVTFQTEPSEDGQLLTWHGHNLAIIKADSELPKWYTAYPYVQFSEFVGWEQVVEWANPLYRVPDPLPAGIREKAAELTRGLNDDSAKAVALLQFVQQEIRYLGMELGAGSYQPTQPEVVLSRRFGDCKDKTLLFCCLMRAAGLTAYPALLNTDYLDKIESWLPSPQNFDHVMACIPMDKGWAWIDPTLTYQSGGLGVRGLPNYRRALILKPGSDRLTAVEIPEKARSSVAVDEKFEIDDFDRPAKLKVVSRYTGRTADSVRRYFAQTTSEQINKDYVNYYAATYPGTKSAGLPRMTEDYDRNLLTVEEFYTVANLWREQGDKNKIKAEFYPKLISDYAVKPKTPVRTMPLGVDHPIDARLTTRVHLPEDWSVTPNDTVTESVAFRAKDKIAVEGRLVTMNYTWESLADCVPPDQVAKHIEVLNRFRDTLGYNLTYTKPSPAETRHPPEPAKPRPFRLNWLLVFVNFLTVLVTGFFGITLLRKKHDQPPLLVPPNAELAGIGGWLILVAFGVCLRPVVLLVQMFTSEHQFYNLDSWEVITIPGNAGYQPALGPLILWEKTGNLLLLIGSLLMVVQFLRRHHTFPKLFIGYVAFAALFLVSDEVLAATLLKREPTTSAQDMKTLTSAIQAVMQALIWIPYMLVSRRVKATFTN